MTKTTLLMASAALLLPVPGFSEVGADVAPGYQVVDVEPDSSKFNEYRDLDDGVYLYGVGADIGFAEGYFFDLHGSNLLRDDQNIFLRGGRRGVCSLSLEWDEIPHLLSTKAQTPYNNAGSGLFTVPAAVGISTKRLGTGLTAGALQANDQLTEAWLDTYLHPTSLGNDREKATVKLDFAAFENLKLRLTGSSEAREGNKVGYAPIGDRPPRSLNIQLAEPIDYKTNEVRFDADYAKGRQTASFSYLVSKFENNIDALTWQNLYTNPAAGTFETWLDGKDVATFGRKPLPQDNQYQNASLSYGLDLPWRSRLAATASYGIARQNADLLPYSTVGRTDSADGIAWNDTAKLPRATAEAEIATRLLNVDYSVAAFEPLTLRAFGRYYGLDDKTEEADWKYITQDVPTSTTGTGTAVYINKRRNVAFDYSKRNAGLDADYRLPWWKTTLGAGYEREQIDREHREADTKENIFKASLRTRPSQWANLRAKYQYGNRKASHYEPEVLADSYWYLPAEATDNIDSGFTFENHPDTRRFDVTDRKRNLYSVQVGMAPWKPLNVTGSYRIRKDDFDSGVTPSQPLLNYAGARTISATDRAAFSPGDQVGLLEDRSKVAAVDVSYEPTPRLRFTAFGSREQGDSRQRGFAFDENFKVNPSGIGAATELGPWTRKSMQWTSDTEDTTYTYGVGAGFAVIPEKLDWGADFTQSSGRTELVHAGWGTVSSVNGATLADTYQFGWRSPPAIRSNRYTISTKLSYKLLQNLSVTLGYLYEYYRLSDWSQAVDLPWFGAVNGNESFLRDSSFASSTQWGNRLPNLGSYLAGSYVAHVGSVAVTYKF